MSQLTSFGNLTPFSLQPFARDQMVSVVVVVAVFGLGVILATTSVLVVLRAHRTEVDLWKLASETRTQREA